MKPRVRVLPYPTAPLATMVAGSVLSRAQNTAVEDERVIEPGTDVHGAGVAGHAVKILRSGDTARSRKATIADLMRMSPRNITGGDSHSDDNRDRNPNSQGANPASGPAITLRALFWVGLLVVAGTFETPEAKAMAKPACATDQEKSIARQGITQFPGAPVAIGSRFLGMKEFTFASALPSDVSIGAWITGNAVAELWKSIDAWGKDTMVRVVISPQSEHAFSLYGKVPTTQSIADPGYLDVYADEGRGIHSHIQLDKIAAVYATDLPSDDPSRRTRGINFYDHLGHNVIGIYASIMRYDPDPAAIEGFNRTRAIIETMPRACDGS